MTIKTLCLIKSLLEEEVRNARDDYEEAKNRYKIEAESTDFADPLADPLADREQALEKFRTVKRKLNERLTAAEDALDDFCGQNWK